MTSSYLIRKKLLPFRDHSTNSSGGVGTSKVGPVMTGPQVRTPLVLIRGLAYSANHSVLRSLSSSFFQNH